MRVYNLNFRYNLGFAGLAAAEGESEGEATVEEDLGKSRDASRTDDEALKRFVICLSLAK